MMETHWKLYIIECRDGELYVGLAQDVERRISEHNKGTACHYTQFRRPVRLIYSEICGAYPAARKREVEVKKFSRIKKLALVKEDLSPLTGLEMKFH